MDKAEEYIERIAESVEVIAANSNGTVAFLVSDLPSASTAGEGARSFVTDSDTAASGNFCLNFCWRGSKQCSGVFRWNSVENWLIVLFDLG